MEQSEHQLQQRAKAQQLCEVIRQAFAGVTLGCGIGLQQAQGLDDYADASACAALRATDEKADWQRIPVNELNRCYSSLSFFDAEGMRFHLPAYLIADLQGTYHQGMAFCLSYLNDYTLAQFALLSATQRTAVSAFLLHLAEDDDEEFERPHILRALDEYWTA